MSTEWLVNRTEAQGRGIVLHSRTTFLSDVLVGSWTETSTDVIRLRCLSDNTQILVEWRCITASRETGVGVERHEPDSLGSFCVQRPITLPQGGALIDALRSQERGERPKFGGIGFSDANSLHMWVKQDK